MNGCKVIFKHQPEDTRLSDIILVHKEGIGLWYVKLLFVKKSLSVDWDEDPVRR